MKKEKTNSVIFTILILMLSGLSLFAQHEIPDNIKDKIANGIKYLENSKTPEDMDMAVKEFTEASIISPKYADVHFYLGKTLSMMQGNAGKAVKEFKKYLELYTDAPDKEKVNKEIAKLEYAIKQKNKSCIIGISLVELSDGIYVRHVSPNFRARTSNIGGPSKSHQMTQTGDKIEKINGINIKGYSIQEVYKLIEKDTNNYTKISLIRGGTSQFELYTYTKKTKMYSYDVRELGEEDLTTIIKDVNTPIVVFFISDFCKTCEQYNSYIINRSSYVSDTVIFIIANIDENTTLTKEFGINQTPIVYFYKDGELYDKIDGYDVELLKKKAGELMAVWKSGATGAHYINLSNLSDSSKVNHVVSGTLNDPRDGKTYKTIEIGNQTWMAENLAYKTNRDCWAYDNNESNLAKYGYLYYWKVAKEACPLGWHLPYDAEWLTLRTYLGGEDVAGGKLKETGNSHWQSQNTGATNEIGFTALPGGECYKYYVDGKFTFKYIGQFGNWWSATVSQVNYATKWWMSYNNNYFNGIYDSKTMGHSVRCVKDSGLLKTKPEGLGFGKQDLKTSGISDTLERTQLSNKSKVKDSNGNLNEILTGAFTDTRDNKTYKTVKIGTQTWMEENLNYTTNNSWCYDDNSNNCNTYGRLYTWVSAKASCPTGWHLPYDSEWTILTTYLGGDTVASCKLKETGTTHWHKTNTYIDNSSGFNALPGGDRNFDDGSFRSISYNGGWWSATEVDASSVWVRNLDCNKRQVFRDTNGKEYGLSVRCIKD